jgi:hypothetical protein
MLPTETAFAGDADRVGRHREGGDAETVKMRLPGRAVGEAGLGMAGEQSDDRSGEMEPNVPSRRSWA